MYDGYNRAVEFETVKPTGITISKMTYNGDNLRVTREVGRFVNEDSVWGKKHQPLSLNLYTYAYNNPVRFIDPSGHVVTDWERRNLSKSDQRKVARAGQDWSRANEKLNSKNTPKNRKAGYREIMRLAHERAKKTIEANIKDNERVQSNGYVVNKKVKKDVATGGRNEYGDAGVLRG
ncbi:RHS repeat-associated core domain-containing protein [Fusibacter sp. JL216-2]|uniref:RHS repeat-associated core domain-containing protein n=1 Tax=Fusibacter sp. JL216-2 TaxID=3071453 RepID=UPI003D334669